MLAKLTKAAPKFVALDEHAAAPTEGRPAAAPPDADEERWAAGAPRTFACLYRSETGLWWHWYTHALYKK